MQFVKAFFSRNRSMLTFVDFKS